MSAESTNKIMKVYNNPLLSPRSRQREIDEMNMTFDNFKHFMQDIQLNVESYSEVAARDQHKFEAIEQDYMHLL